MKYIQLTVIVVMLSLGGGGWSVGDPPALVYREEIAFQGTCGSGTNDLRVVESDIGLWEGPTAFCVLPNGSIWIADTYNHAIKRFDPSGRVSRSIPLDSIGGIDDMACDCGGRIALRSWINKSHLLLLDSTGSVLVRFPLPQGQRAAAAYSLITMTDTNLFAAYNDSTGGDVGLRYALSGELLEVRNADLRLWVQSAGAFHVPDPPGKRWSAFDSFAPLDIRRADGSLFVFDSAAAPRWAVFVGLDSTGGLYLGSWTLPENSQKGDYADFIVVYNSAGRKQAQFSVKPYRDVIADSYLAEVAPNGDVYILTVSDDITTWTMYRYTAH